MRAPDRSSAEWIAEAPSNCSAEGVCDTLPLTNFGTVAFTNALATAKDHSGTISDTAWTASQVELRSDGGVLPGGRFDPKARSGSALPSDLSPYGSAFAEAPTRNEPSDRIALPEGRR